MLITELLREHQAQTDSLEQRVEKLQVDCEEKERVLVQKCEDIVLSNEKLERDNAHLKVIKEKLKDYNENLQQKTEEETLLRK